MARRLDARDPGFADAFAALIGVRGARLDEAEGAAREAIAAVRAQGVTAVLQLAARFDGISMRAEDLRVSETMRKRARAECTPDLVAALEHAAERIAAFHERQKPGDTQWTDEQGLTLGWRWSPMDCAGLYAPGGLAAYPSSVLMNALPAKAAGVSRLVMTTPPVKLHANPAILAAADIAGVDEIWAIGGAQAIAAMAYGAGDLAACDVIVGPGNAYVAAAKKLVFGDVGIDAVAGPSEVFIVADDTTPPAWLAADLLAQAEHDIDAQAVLFTDDSALADAVDVEISRALGAGQAGSCAGESWARHGAIIRVARAEDAAAWINRAAPEHVQLALANPAPLIDSIRHAGAIFIGAQAPEALGDYIAGPSHVLPTARAARYASGVSVLTFMKRTTLIGARAATGLNDVAARIADAEGLPAHARSLRMRGP